jgi:hypothetical protein
MRLDDGYQTLVSFSANPSVSFWERTVTPPGLDGGGPTTTTTMHNTALRTFAPKFLITMTESSCVVAYDPVFYDEALQMLNVNQLITITFPDGSSLQFWGWLDKFVPNEHQEGEQPTAQVSINPSNQNDSGVETLPVYTAAA